MRPFLMSYGGGHAAIIAAVASELTRRGVSYDLIGLTTAHAAFVRAGLAPLDVTALVEPEDEAFYAAVEQYLPSESHPDISPAQTHTYFALGFADLARRFGISEAHRIVAARGRKAFEPTHAFVRRFARKRPSLLVATTAPRFELAAIRAARLCGVPSLALGDHFLVGETPAITSGSYADHLVVLAHAVAQRLHAAGGALPQLHVLGNPAFDSLAPAPGDAARRAALRERIGCMGERLLFWPLGGAAQSGSGEALLSPQQAARALEPIMQAGGWRCVMRAHPNWPVAADTPHLCPPDFTPEDCLLASDLVVAESTTLGLQALLRGIPVIALGHADLTQYPYFGWATLVHTPTELQAAVLGGEYRHPPAELRALVGRATGRVADLIGQLQQAPAILESCA